MNTTVLVVEDDLEINELIGEYLSLENIKYLQATTGQAGIHLADTQHPDALILDLMLPDIDGFEVARTLSAQRTTFDIPIIILSCMCQDCDKEKGFASGALFYMNKPFLPDDLLMTLRQALEWKQNLRKRIPSGEIILGHHDQPVCLKALNQMIVDLYVQTDLADAQVSEIREAVETLDRWTTQWNGANAAQSRLKLEYRIQLPVQGNGAPQSIEWKMTRMPEILADAFFGGKPAANAVVAGNVAGGIGGWGTSTMLAKPPNETLIAPPLRWLQLLAKTGAARFEKDSRAHTVRFSRSAGGTGPLTNATTVPVVEIDGMRYPTRLRDEAVAAKRR